MLSTLLLAGIFGLLAPVLLPMLAKHTQSATRVGNAYAAFAAKALKRPAFGVGNRLTLSLRQLSFDEVYETETVTIDGVEKKVKRRAQNVHRWGKTPFTFFDEDWGVTFDLRDLLIGDIEHQLRDDGDMVFEHREWTDDGELVQYDEFVRAFFEVEERRGLDLHLDESVRPMIDGSEKAGWWEHLYEAVKRMYLHRQEETSLIRLLLPFIVGGCAFAVGYYIIGPGQMPGGSGGGGSGPITVGSLVLLSVPAVDRRKAAGAVAALGVVAATAVLALTLGPVFFFIAGAFALGALVLPMLTTILAAAGSGTNLAELMLWAGLQAFEEPVIDLTADGQYRVAEADTFDGLEEIPKVPLLCSLIDSRTLVGLTCDVSPEAFGRAGYSMSDVVDYLPDGEFASQTSRDVAPRGYTVTEEISNAGHAGFMPDRDNLESSTTYVRTDNWLGRFRNIATGDTMDVAETEATNEFADGDAGFDDGQLMKYSALASAVGIGFWVVVGFAF